MAAGEYSHEISESTQSARWDAMLIADYIALGFLFVSMLGAAAMLL